MEEKMTHDLLENETHRKRICKKSQTKKIRLEKTRNHIVKKLAEFRKLFFTPLPGGQRFHTHPALLGALFLLRFLRYV